MTRATLIETLKTNGNLTTAQAEVAFRALARAKAFRHNAHDGYVVKHGAFMDGDVIRRAYEVGSAKENR